MLIKLSLIRDKGSTTLQISCSVRNATVKVSGFLKDRRTKPDLCSIALVILFISIDVISPVSKVFCKMSPDRYNGLPNCKKMLQLRCVLLGESKRPNNVNVVSILGDKL